MCRLGFFKSKDKSINVTKTIMLATTKWGSSNAHGTGIAWKQDDEILIHKEPIEASHFWNKNDLSFETDSTIYHVRYATTGQHTSNNTHPFQDKLTGITLVHNGVIYNYEEAKKELIEKGFIFQGECDSEVLLWAYVYKGNDFIKWLSEKEVRGTATILIQHKDGLIKAFTNSGSLEVFETDDGFYGFSDDALGFYEKYPAYKIETGTLYEISSNAILIISENNKLKEYETNYSSFNNNTFYESYEKYKARKNKKNKKKNKLKTQCKLFNQNEFDIDNYNYSYSDYIWD